MDRGGEWKGKFLDVFVRMGDGLSAREVKLKGDGG